MSLYWSMRYAITDYVYSLLPRARMLQRELDAAKQQLIAVQRGQREVPGSNPDYVGFSSAYPGHQAALDLFQWTTAMPSASGLIAGDTEHFSDARVTMAAPYFNGFAGKTILELGPYEAYNTAQFEQFGAASVVAIENSRENFLKCLIIKNAFGLKSTFLHGDMLAYLHNSQTRWDICWASGILYHMKDPLRLLEGIAKVSKATFIWTQYFDESRSGSDDHFEASKNKTIDFHNRSVVLHHRNYNRDGSSFFSGGDSSFSYWMSKDDIMHCMGALGFNRIVMLLDNPNHPPGAAMFFLAFSD